MGAVTLYCAARGLPFTIDAEDFELVWLMPRWYTHGGGYLCGHNGFDKPVALHRLLLGALPGETVDHADGDPRNNCRANLRLCSSAENARNRRLSRTSSSGFKGVTRIQGRPTPWRARITVDGKPIHLGLFATPEEAHDAYRKAAQKLHGEFARFS